MNIVFLLLSNALGDPDDIALLLLPKPDPSIEWGEAKLPEEGLLAELHFTFGGEGLEGLAIWTGRGVVLLVGRGGIDGGIQ